MRTRRRRKGRKRRKKRRRRSRKKRARGEEKKEEKKFLGRTATAGVRTRIRTKPAVRSLILLFYLVFYGFLAGMFSLTMWVMLQTLDENVPRHQDRVSSPGEVFFCTL
uniref:Uncharacterized protein n=1 Tax=Amphiprion percula TaxID=161767 RepID=A0A3P8U3V2_AMPPE